ncbi:hypothetical protein HZF05_12985 [Sphingomonas sp. CGMCC 1.13654]|uniref:DUF429 domain-containing protein n=1 Tax=Sphingomonas chungangi TaxID=2683589 RepID=A0A838L6A0_9SPHN|nr:hypothetical protein [Sphingomonas chungangi]MVW54128.1 hypothetical protein [Sphingomonas chungangi]
MRHFERFACIDWSGATGAFQPGIAVAVCERGGPPALVQSQGQHWSREEVLHWLPEQGDCLIGFDFSASLPFVDAHAFFPGWSESPPDARTLWALVDRIASDEPNLGANRFVDHPEASRYFRRHGGRTGDRFGHGIGRMRVIESAARTAGVTPTSSFNLVGASQVGKASLTAMRLLHQLGGRVPVWPFDPVPESGPLMVELYTSLAARAAGVPKGRSKLRDAQSLDAALAALGDPPHAALARYDDHITDAMIGAAWLRRAAGNEALWHPTALTPSLARTEGWTFGLS